MALLIYIGILVFLVWKKRNDAEAEEDYLDQVSGMTTQCSYKNLKPMTEKLQ